MCRGWTFVFVAALDNCFVIHTADAAEKLIDCDGFTERIGWFVCFNRQKKFHISQSSISRQPTPRPSSPISLRRSPRTVKRWRNSPKSMLISPWKYNERGDIRQPIDVEMTTGSSLLASAARRTRRQCCCCCCCCDPRIGWFKVAKPVVEQKQRQCKGPKPTDFVVAFVCTEQIEFWQCYRHSRLCVTIQKPTEILIS